MTLEQHKGVIFVVDDVPTNLEVLLEFLSADGFEVLVSTDGESAIEQIEYAQPDIILLDVMMPGIDGFETCRRLKQHETTQNIPIIFMTALTDAVDKITGFQVGAVDYITKPLQHEEVLARVTTHLTLYQQRREIEQLREQDRRSYESLSQMKDEVVRTASHDLKSPLSSVLLSVYLLRQHGRIDDEAGQRYLDKIEADAERMKALITDLLDLARIETGLALNKRMTELEPFLRANLEIFIAMAHEQQITLELIPPPQPVQLFIDPDRMSQVLHNLLHNAIKYNKRGGYVTLSVECAQPHEITLRVADTGIGIPAPALPLLFEKFYRVDREHSMDGTGLGLSITYSIVEQHGGKICVESEEGVGSTFEVILPIV